MDFLPLLLTSAALTPLVAMTVIGGLSLWPTMSVRVRWRLLLIASTLGLAAVALALALAAWDAPAETGGVGLGPLRVSVLGLVIALLVQFLGVVIGRFSARYLDGERGQKGYITALSGTLAGVQLLVLADHWVLLIAAWASVGITLQRLLCFYPERPFARLAAHKKFIADRVADVLLVVAAIMAWNTVGSGSLSALWTHVAAHGMSPALHISALATVLAVVLRTALFPVHGWLIQVMEAPTPVSALLHAGVLNLGGFVLIRFAPLLEQAPVARTLLVLVGLATAVLAGMVMLTRISIKVRLAWSTVAQMGFMVLECGLGLYTLAVLHLLGHSLYKAHAFLSSAGIVREVRLRRLRVAEPISALSVWLAPVVSTCAVAVVLGLMNTSAWPWWWTVVIGLAWAPMMWCSTTDAAEALRAYSWGALMVAGLALAALLVHQVPIGIMDHPHHGFGVMAMVGMLGLYVCLVLLQLRPQVLGTWRRWAYAGFYVDEAYTRAALRLWPSHWGAPPFRAAPTATESLL